MRRGGGGGLTGTSLIRHSHKLQGGRCYSLKCQYSGKSVSVFYPRHFQFTFLLTRSLPDTMSNQSSDMQFTVNLTMLMASAFLSMQDNLLVMSFSLQVGFFSILEQHKSIKMCPTSRDKPKHQQQPFITAASVSAL